MNTHQVQVTKTGLESLEHELDELRGNKRPTVVQRLSRAREQGDLSENADYASAKEDLEFLDGKISELVLGVYSLFYSKKLP